MSTMAVIVLSDSLPQFKTNFKELVAELKQLLELPLKKTSRLQASVNKGQQC